MNRTILGILIGALVIVGVMVGTDADTSNYAAERTQQVQAQEVARTERTAIIEAERTERMRLDAERERAASAAQERTINTLLIVMLAGGIVIAVVAVVRKPAQPTVVYLPAPAQAPQPPAPIIVLAGQLPGYQPAVINGQWVLESDADYMTPQTALKLVANQRRSPIDR